MNKEAVVEKNVYLDRALVRVSFALKHIFGWHNLDYFSIVLDEDRECILVTIEDYASFFGECSVTVHLYARTINDDLLTEEDIVGFISNRMRLLAWHVPTHVDNILDSLHGEIEHFGNKEYI